MIIFEFKDHDGAFEFFRRVSQLKDDNVDARSKILIDMAREGYMQRVQETQRTEEEVLKDWSEEFNVLKIDHKAGLEDENNE